MTRNHKKPTLVCVNNGAESITRYIPKSHGGFFTERFEVTDREQFNRSLTTDTVEGLRLGHMSGQEYPENLPERA